MLTAVVGGFEIMVYPFNLPSKVAPAIPGTA
jgi:hypothetical protein